MKNRVWGWEFFKAIEENCKADIGYGMLSDVTGKGFIQDRVESFFPAETLKYLYLLFSSENIVSLEKEVFTTEGHILPVKPISRKNK